MDYSPPGSSVHGDSLGKNTRVGCHALLQEIFPTQGSNLELTSPVFPALADRFFITSTTWEALVPPRKRLHVTMLSKKKGTKDKKAFILWLYIKQFVSRLWMVKFQLFNTFFYLLFSFIVHISHASTLKSGKKFLIFFFRIFIRGKIISIPCFSHTRSHPGSQM